MRNAVLSILLFIITMSFVYYLNTSIINLCDNIEAQVEDIESKITNDQMEDAYYNSLELLNTIQEKNVITSIYLNHHEFDNLLNETLKLTTYLAHEDETEAHTSLHLVKYNTGHLKKLQIPTLENIL